MQQTLTHCLMLLLADDNYSVNWKFLEGFIQLNKVDLRVIVSELNSCAHSCFDREQNLVEVIISKSNVWEPQLLELE